MEITGGDLAGHSRAVGKELVLSAGTVMPGLCSVEPIALSVAAFLLASEAAAREAAAGGIRTASGAVTLAVGPILLSFAPVRLRLLLWASVNHTERGRKGGMNAPPLGTSSGRF